MFFSRVGYFALSRWLSDVQIDPDRDGLSCCLRKMTDLVSSRQQAIQMSIFWKREVRSSEQRRLFLYFCGVFLKTPLIDYAMCLLLICLCSYPPWSSQYSLNVLLFLSEVESDLEICHQRRFPLSLENQFVIFDTQRIFSDCSFLSCIVRHADVLIQSNLPVHVH